MSNKFMNSFITHLMAGTFLITGLISGVHHAQAEMAYPVLADQPKLEVVAELNERPGNVAVAMDGRVFITMHPVEKHKCRLLEVIEGGKTKPYPNEEISCGEPKEDGKGVYRALGIRSTVRYMLMVLDMGTKEIGPRLLAFTHNDNTLKAVHKISESVVTPQSFMQDIALNWTSNVVYIADMGQTDKTKQAEPSIIMLFPNPLREPMRRLAGHKSLMPPQTPMQADGRDMKQMVDGKEMPVYLGLNPMTIDAQRNWLYYGPMAAGKIYRVPLDKMEDPVAYPDGEIEKYIEEYADKPPSDGITIDAAGNIYVTNVRDNEIGVIDPKTRGYRTYIKDPRLIWPDGMSFGPDGMIYLTVNQLNRAAPFNLGKEEGKPPYLVVKFKPIVTGAVGR